MRKGRITTYQNKVLNLLAGRVDDFYLAGGTALSLFYFKHRLSLDLDFFTPKLSYSRVQGIITYLKASLGTDITLIGRQSQQDKVGMYVYNIYFSEENALKIDFIEDIFGLVQRPKLVEGIRVLSLEDIYLRKIYAIIGFVKVNDAVGRQRLIGGRQEAKDFFDLYFLSHTFMGLAEFAGKYLDATIKEGLITWFRTYKRMHIIDGVLSIITDKDINYKVMEVHFKKEIDKIIELQIGTI